MALVSVATEEMPSIDGYAREPIWEMAPAITTLDYASQRPITLKSVHSTEEIAFLVTYPDAAPSTTHKSWGWDTQEDIYKPMPNREDMFVFKWSMVGNDVNLALRETAPHRADIWFWKAHRTDPSGYADDKWQLVSPEAHPKAKELLSPIHGNLYFRRVGDTGISAYEEKRFYDYDGDMLPKYYPRQPQGSHADIRAKGVWHDGRWTIEWRRKLHTGHDDDIAFAPGHTYLFAVSCYEMTAVEVNPAWSQPLYRSGDAFDRLLLTIPGKDRS